MLVNGEYIWDAPRPDTVSFPEDEQTVPRLLRKYVPNYALCRALGTRAFNSDGTRGDYEWLTYLDMLHAAAELCEGMKAAGLRQGDVVVIFASTRAEWTIADYACQCAGFVTAPLYDSQDDAELAYVCRLVEPRAAVVTFNVLPKIAHLSREGVVFEHIIVMDDRADDRGIVLRHLPALAPTWVSTAPRSAAAMAPLLSHWNDAFAQMIKASKTTIDLDLSLNASATGDATAEELAADEFASYYHRYNSQELPPTEIKGVTSDQSLLDMVTSTVCGLREVGRRAMCAAGTAVPPTTMPLVPAPADQTPDTMMTFIFTSGTTGEPKAAMLQHRAMMYAAKCLTARGGVAAGDLEWPRPATEVELAFLPIAHVFARALQYHQLLTGAAVGFFQGRVPVLFDDIQTLRPTLLCVVPRILQRVYSGIMTKVDGMNPVARTLFHRQLRSRCHRMYDLGQDQESFLDKKLFAGIRNQFGGNVRMIFSGSAPLSAELGRFFQATLCPNLYEGYASSETASCGAVQTRSTRTPGHIGVPLGDVEAKLVPVPALEYDPAASAAAPTGELCLRGHNVFLGYYKNAEATASVLDAEGWFHTGDVCTFVLDHKPMGSETGAAAGPYIKIVDRKSSVMKLSQGEFVATDSIMGALSAARFCGQVFVGGSSEESYILAVVVPDEATFVPAARKLIDPGSEEDVTPEVVARYCRDPRAIALVHREIVAEAQKIGLKGFEVPKAVLLEPVAWTPENGLATASMKLRSPAIKKAYMDKMRAVYAAVNAAGLAGASAGALNFDAIAKVVQDIE